MLEQLKSVIGQPGPFIIETQHGLIKEPCITIEERHIEQALEKLIINFEQTSESTFIARPGVRKNQ
jgi:hypothetical protein